MYRFEDRMGATQLLQFLALKRHCAVTVTECAMRCCCVCCLCVVAVVLRDATGLILTCSATMGVSLSLRHFY